MADEIASAMEQEMVEEQAIKCPRPSAKRQRKGSPDAREEADKERVDDSLLQDARRIKENIRVYMNATDRNVSAKVQKHVNGKMQQLIDIMETIYDKNYEKTFLVQRVVKDTLASSEMYDIIVNALVEKAVPMVIEGLKSESKTIQRPLSEPQTSREFPCVKEQPLLADAHAIIETTENESFQENVHTLYLVRATGPMVPTRDGSTTFVEASRWRTFSPQVLLWLAEYVKARSMSLLSFPTIGPNSLPWLLDL
ncbi:unnamed protein product [Nezara viridula]|uniref:DNTTIP1 dimerisation domain-containing protein n=1 Tax=Nezara viridula TaxID=85310 RepID=A0A9P0MUF2_NEZVI|nr:unnamed protein product [Nezara viridula]